MEAIGKEKPTKFYLSHFYNDLKKNHEYRCYYCGRYYASKQAKANHKKEHMKEKDFDLVAYVPRLKRRRWACVICG